MDHFTGGGSAGFALPSDAGVEDIRAALHRLLEEPGFRAAARTLGDAVAAEATAPTAVEELEALAAAGAACGRRAPIAA